jgi:hypothetical protein
MGKKSASKEIKEQGIFGNFYASLASRPAAEIEEIFRKLIGPHKLFMMMEGTKMTLHFGGLRIFDISAVLAEAGIPDGDPRQEVYKSIKGGFAPKDAINALRGIAAREEGVCRGAGAIPLNAGEQKRVWWVPINGTSAFKTAIDGLIAEYHKVRDDQISLPYAQIRAEKETAWMDAAKASYENLQALGKTNGDKKSYLKTAQVLFDSRFPSPRSIAEKVVAYSESLQDELPEEVEIAFQDLKREEAKRIRAETEAMETQTRMKQVELQVREAEARKLEDEQMARARMLKEAMAREYTQTKELVMKLQLQISELALEIVKATQEGKPISGSLRRRWRSRMEQLNALSPENPTWQSALDALKEVSEKAGKKDEAPSADEVVRAEQQVDTAIQYLRSRTGMAVVSDSLYALIKAGKGETALREVRGIKNKLEHGLEEVNALEELLVNREED